LGDNFLWSIESGEELMRLTIIPKIFVGFAAVSRSGPFGPFRNYRRRKNKKFAISNIRVEIIDAVTGQKTSGKAFEESAAKFKKWLKLRNVRAEFTDVRLNKTSAWFKLNDAEFIDYPIIVKMGGYKAPYLIKRVQDRKTFKGKTTFSIQLETTENIDYLAILSQKKELLLNKKGRK